MLRRRFCRRSFPANGKWRRHVFQQNRKRLVAFLHLRRERREADFDGAKKTLLARGKLLGDSLEVGLAQQVERIFPYFVTSIPQYGADLGKRQRKAAAFVDNGVGLAGERLALEVCPRCQQFTRLLRLTLLAPETREAYCGARV